jgi:hypothetical protein
MHTIYRCADMTFPALTSHRRSENICIIIECNCGISKFKMYRPTVLLYLQTLNSVGSVAPMRPLSPPPPLWAMRSTKSTLFSATLNEFGAPNGRQPAIQVEKHAHSSNR